MTTRGEGEGRGKGHPEGPRAPRTAPAECSAPARGRGPAFLPHNTMPNLTGGEEPGELFAGGRLASGANLSPCWASSPCTRRAPARQASPRHDVSHEQQGPGGQHFSIRGPIFIISRKPMTFFSFFFFCACPSTWPSFGGSFCSSSVKTTKINEFSESRLPCARDPLMRRFASF